MNYFEGLTILNTFALMWVISMIIKFKFKELKSKGEK